MNKPSIAHRMTKFVEDGNELLNELAALPREDRSRVRQTVNLRRSSRLAAGLMNLPSERAFGEWYALAAPGGFNDRLVAAVVDVFAEIDARQRSVH